MSAGKRKLEIVPVANARIVTAVEGDGPALVMLPSFGRDGLDDFDQVAGRVAAAGRRVLRPQPRGATGSKGPMHDIDLRALARDVAGVIEALGGAGHRAWACVRQFRSAGAFGGARRSRAGRHPRGRQRDEG